MADDIIPIFMGLFDWAKGFGTGDSGDGFYYANAHAAGSQLYPAGLSKYFDLYSVDGLTKYATNWVWEEI